jgi:hypothetical protein
MALRGRRDPRKVVGWQLASNMRTTLVLDASKMALGQRRPGDLAAGPLTGLDAAIDRAVSLDELDRVAREVPPDRLRRGPQPAPRIQATAQRAARALA